nr:GtrA family protein [Bacilli bacterium]
MRNRVLGLVRFGLVGVLGFLVDTGVVDGLRIVHGNLYVDQAIAYLAAATFTWWLNRHFTFKTKDTPSWREWGRYLLANLSGGVANYLIFVLATMFSRFIYHHAIIAIALGSLAGLVFNFIFSSLFVFKHKEDS